METGRGSCRKRLRPKTGTLRHAGTGVLEQAEKCSHWSVQPKRSGGRGILSVVCRTSQHLAQSDGERMDGSRSILTTGRLPFTPGLGREEHDQTLPRGVDMAATGDVAQDQDNIAQTRGPSAPTLLCGCDH